MTTLLVIDDDPTFKVCPCGRRYTRREWDALEWVGVQEADETKVLHLRNCTCGSTMAVEVARTEAA